MSNNVLLHIRNCKFLLDPKVSNELLDVQFDEFVPIIEINNTIDSMCTDSSTSISSKFEPYERGKTSGYVSVDITHKRGVIVYYNPTGNIRNSGGFSMMFDLDTICGEEDLFMLSTVQDTFGMTIEDIEMFNKIWSLYYE